MNWALSQLNRIGDWMFGPRRGVGPNQDLPPEDDVPHTRRSNSPKGDDTDEPRASYSDRQREHPRSPEEFIGSEMESPGAELTRAELESWIDRDAYRYICKSGVPELTEAEINDLEERYGAKSRTFPEFDPATHASHRSIAQGIEEDNAAITQLKLLNEEMENGLRHSPQLGLEPTPISWDLKIAAILICTIAFSPTLYTIFIGMGQTVLIAWAAAAFVGIALGTFIVHLTTDVSGEPDSKSGLTWGILVSSAFFFLRLSFGASGISSIAYLLLDVSIVAGLHSLGASHRRQQTDWANNVKRRQPFTVQIAANNEAIQVRQVSLNGWCSQRLEIESASIKSHELQLSLKKIARGAIRRGLIDNRSGRRGSDYEAILHRNFNGRFHEN